MELLCPEVITTMIDDFFSGEWIEFPTRMEESDMECDFGLIPTQLVILRLPHASDRYKNLQDVWGHKGFKLL